MASVALVVLDTLRSDTFEDHFDWLPGRHFSRAYSTSHWTVPAHASLFTGQYASEVGVHGAAGDLDCEGPVLAEALGDAGYHTRCLTANPQLYRYEGWDRGFDEFVGRDSLPFHADDAFDWGECMDDLDSTGVRQYVEAIGRCVRADCATLQSVRQGYERYARSEADGGAEAVRDRVRAADFGDDEFCFVNLTETHTPYHPPTTDDDPVTVVAADAFTDEPLDFDRAREAYERSAEYLAETYRDVFAELSANFEYVITLSDHGELFGEYGMVSHSVGLFPELVHVPLVVSGEGVDDDVDHGVVSLLDVHRTVAELAGVDVSSRGRDLLSEREPRDFRTEYHGLGPSHEAQFARRDVPASARDRCDSPLSGFVSRTGAYAYETHTDGFQTLGEFVVDPRERLAELDAATDDREVADDADPADAMGRVEALGDA
jgi:arylsulfatase